MRRKIIIFHHVDNWGGGTVSLLTVVNSLKKKYDVAVYIPHKESDTYIELTKQNINVKTLEDNFGTIHCYSGSFPTFEKTFFICLAKIIVNSYRKVTEIIKYENPDIVIANSMTISWIGRVAKRYGKKAICFVRETASSEPGMKLIYYCLNHYFDGVAYLSNYDLDHYNGKASIQKVVPDTVCVGTYTHTETVDEARKKLGLENGKFYLLFTGGRNTRVKGWNVIRNAMKRIENYNIELLVVGAEASPEEELHNIRCLGTIIDMETIYCAVDAIVFPSVVPHQARPAYEAGFVKKPVIITDYPQTEEFVENEYNGLTFPENNDFELSKAILRLYNDKELLKRLGQNNYEAAWRQHNPEHCEQKLFDFVDEVETI